MIVQVQAKCFKCDTKIQISTDLEGGEQRRLSMCKCDEQEAKLIKEVTRLTAELKQIKEEQDGNKCTDDEVQQKV